MTISITKPTVGGSENTWGATVNTALDDVVDVLNGDTASTPDLTAGSWKVGGTAITSNAADLNILSGAAAAGVTSTEFGYLDGVTSAIQTQITSSLFPAGGIILWSGSTASIPSGWVLCNGSNSTPDLRNRFVVGAGSSYGVNATGGASSVTLSISQIPAHNHSASSSSSTTINDSGHSHSIPTVQTSGSGSQLGSRDGGNALTINTNSATTGITASTSTSTSIGNKGGGGSHENRPPYYALAYIMKT
jgi:microcystin-dependent protein